MLFTEIIHKKQTWEIKHFPSYYSTLKSTVVQYDSWNTGWCGVSRQKQLLTRGGMGGGRAEGPAAIGDAGRLHLPSYTWLWWHGFWFFAGLASVYPLEGASLVAQRLKRLPAMRETWVRSLGGEDPLEKEMATHSTILAWRLPWTEEPGGLHSKGSQRVGHNWTTSLSLSPSWKKTIQRYLGSSCFLLVIDDTIALDRILNGCCNLLKPL